MRSHYSSLIFYWINTNIFLVKGERFMRSEEKPEYNPDIFLKLSTYVSVPL